MSVKIDKDLRKLMKSYEFVNIVSEVTILGMDRMVPWWLHQKHQVRHDG